MLLALDPKSSASTNFATSAFAQNVLSREGFNSKVYFIYQKNLGGVKFESPPNSLYNSTYRNTFL